jgi:alpha-2-macroglobulin
MRKTNHFLLIFVLLLFVLVVGCQTTDVDIESIATPTPTSQPLPPQVIEIDPQEGAGMEPDGAIQITFDQPMDPEASADAWSLLDAQGQPVEGELSWPDSRTLRFTPDEDLEPNRLYKGSLDGTAVSAKGLAIPEYLSFRFSVLGELLVTQVFPADGTDEVESSAMITVVFNRPVVPLVMTAQQADLPDPLQITPAVFGQGEWLNTSVYVFQPEEPLRSGTTYTLTIAAGLSDSNGAQLNDDYEWQFTTINASLAYFALSDWVTNPRDYFVNVPPDQDFKLTFNQPMDHPSTETAFSLTSSDGEPVAVDFEWDESDTSVAITPSEPLALESDYLLELSASAEDSWGSPLEAGLAWHFQTHPFPAIISTYPEANSTQGDYSGRLTIYFASPMDIASIEGKISLTPSPETDIEWTYNPWDWSISYYGLAPSTTYRVRIDPGLADIYGNAIKIGQSFRFATAAYGSRAYLKMPHGPAIYRVGGSQDFFISYVNADIINLGLYRMTPLRFIDMQTGRLDQYDYEPHPKDLVKLWQHVPTEALNSLTLKGFPLKDAQDNSLEPGFYFLTLGTWIHDEHYYQDNRILIVADANLTMKTTRSEILAWLTDLENGEPLADVSLTIYDEDFRPLGEGSTDADGLLYLELPLSEDAYDARYMMTNDGQHFAFAVSRWDSGVSPGDFGIWSSYYVTPGEPVSYIYTDRPLYRPGHPVSFKGILRENDDLTYSLPEQDEVVVLVSNYQDTIYEETLPLSEFGSFSGQLTLDEDTILGSYRISARYPDSDDTIDSVHFSVAEYRKPEFQVDVSASPGRALPGDKFDFTVAAEFFSGGGLSSADVVWGVYANSYSFQPAGEFSRYSFSDLDRDVGYFDRAGYTYDEMIAEGSAQTEKSGQAVIDVSAVLSEAGDSQRLSFEASVTDLAGNSVSGRTEVIVHQSAVHVGARSQRYVGSTEAEQTFELVALDWDADPVPGQLLDVEIVERRWYSVQTQNPDGTVNWESDVEEIPVVAFEDIETDAQGRAEVSFTPPNGGVFKAIVTSRDDQGNPARAAAYMWVSSSDYVAWRQTDDRSLDLIMDKDRYAPGETAEILIASPFQGQSYALVTVERGHIRSTDVILLTSNSYIYELPVSAEMAPNIYVSVTVIKGADEAGPPDFRMGMAEFDVETNEQTINVEIIPEAEQVGPGDQVSYTVRTTDQDGQPVSAEVSLALTDLATLTLMGPNSAPILDYFYSARALSVRTAVPIVYGIDHYNARIEEQMAQGEGMGSGDGKGAADGGVFDVRQDFPDTAYWNAFVVTDDDGLAEVTVTLPDNLTTWRMDGRAVTLDTRVGDTIEDIISTKPLLLRPQAPRFFVVRDETRLGAAVHNNSKEDLSVDITLQVEGLELSTAATQTVEIPAGEQAYITWQATVLPDAQRVDLIFSAQGGGYRDASRPTLSTLEGGGIPVYRYVVPETVGTAGLLDEVGAQTEAIILPAEYDQVTGGDLSVEIEPSLVAGMAAGLDYLEHYPYECVEQTVSRFLPNVLTAQALQAAGRDGPEDLELYANLEDQVEIALRRLGNWQNSDGGWGWWHTNKSNTLTTAYVALSLIDAQQAGYEIDEGMLEEALDFLYGNLASVTEFETRYILNRQAFLLYVLARGDQAVPSKATQLYKHRQNMSLYSRAFLAQTLYLTDSEDPRLDTLISDINNAAIMSATGTHWEEEWRDYWNWNTDTRTTAIVLAALIQIDPDNALNPNAVRWLMTHRTQGYWRSTQETAWSLMGLTGWMNATGELQADYDYEIALNGEQVGAGNANVDNLQETYQLRLDVADLLADETNRLTISRDDGPGNLYYTAHLSLSLPVEDVEALDRGIIISRSYFDPEDRETPITQAKQGDVLLGRLSIIVPSALHYAIIDDPLPAGLEAIDQRFETSPQESAPDRYDYDDIWQRGWGWWYFDHVELRDERLVVSADYLPAGTYIYTYLVRASTPGEFRVIPPTAQEFYFPEVYGRGDGSLFTVMP